MTPIRFDDFLKTAPPTIVVMANAPVFTIITANDAYLEATGTILTDLAGTGFLEAFPEHTSPDTCSNTGLLEVSLMEALQSKQKTVIDGHRYDIRNRKTGEWQIRYWINKHS